MVDFTFTDEQENMREVAHHFAETEIRPHVWEYDRDAPGRGRSSKRSGNSV